MGTEVLQEGGLEAASDTGMLSGSNLSSILFAERVAVSGGFSGIGTAGGNLCLYWAESWRDYWKYPILYFVRGYGTADMDSLECLLADIALIAGR